MVLWYGLEDKQYFIQTSLLFSFLILWEFFSSGWGGKGLGASEQGIVDPISGGDVRDRQDMFKGVGVDLKDPFEQFRKNKSHGFIARMKARDEMREKSKVFTDFAD